MADPAASLAIDEPIGHATVDLPRLLLVEGKAALEFFVEFLKAFGVENEIQVLNFGSLGQLRPYLRTLGLSPGFAGVVTLGIVRDAEKDAPSAFQSVSDAVGAAGLTPPRAPREIGPEIPRITTYILPDCLNPGMLETVILAALSADPAMECVDSYMDCVKAALNIPAANPLKARLQTFLASRPRCGVSTLVAIRQGHIPLMHPAFDDLLAFTRTVAGSSATAEGPGRP